MARLSLAIVSLAYYLPFFGLWRIILEKQILFEIPLFGFNFGVNIPNSGIVLLFIYSLLSWFVLFIVFIGIEKLIKVDLLEELNLRNGMLYSIKPNFTLNILDIIASIVLSILLAKYMFLSILQMIVSVGLLNWLEKIASFGGSSIGLSFSQVIESFLSRPFEMTALSFSLLVLIVSFLGKREQRYRFFNDISRTQEIRHQKQNEVIIPRIHVKID